MIKWRKKKWAKLVMSGGEENAWRVLICNTEREILLKDLGVGKRLILKGTCTIWYRRIRTGAGQIFQRSSNQLKML